jgi:choline-glycine betaine transporter
VLLVPTALMFLWSSVLGRTALYRELFGQGGLVAEDGTVDTEASLFGLLEGLPGGPVVIGLALLLIVSMLCSMLGGVVAAALLVVDGRALRAADRRDHHRAAVQHRDDRDGSGTGQGAAQGAPCDPAPP